ncbi:MAG: type II secretion system protein [Planctomycetota bacterium]|nr:MAG: type II secretion system protein [Planctomycetota bacterium]
MRVGIDERCATRRRINCAPAALGFSLVELLVVLACLGILIGMLASAVFSALERARSADCGERLRQLGFAHHLTVDNRQRIDSKKWDEVLTTFIEDETEVFFCPADFENAPVTPSYGMNRLARRMAEGDSAKILMLDFATLVADPFVEDLDATWHRDIRPRHLGYLNILKFDGSVHAVTPDDIDPTDCVEIERLWRPERALAVQLDRCREANSATDAEGSASDPSEGGGPGGASGPLASTAPDHVLCGLDESLALDQPGDDYYFDFRGRDEKYLQGGASAMGHTGGDSWYYITPDGGLYELTPPAGRADLVGDFVEHVGTDVYQDPSLLHDKAEESGGACEE